jgi:hypothetical protein
MIESYWKSEWPLRRGEGFFGIFFSGMNKRHQIGRKIARSVYFELAWLKSFEKVIRTQRGITYLVLQAKQEEWFQPSLFQGMPPFRPQSRDVRVKCWAGMNHLIVAGSLWKIMGRYEYHGSDSWLKE